jgi:hypothetical protein
MEKRELTFLSKIQNKHDALKMIKYSAYYVYLVAVLAAAIGFWGIPAAIITSVIYLILAFFLHKFKSRIAALLLLLFPGFALFEILQKAFRDGGEMGNTIFVSLFLFIVIPAIRSVEATFKYQKYKKAVIE